MNLSFSGCGFLGIYHVGVASCLREYAPHLVHEKVAGASAGSLAACALITGCALGDCTSYVLRIAVRARSRALGPIHPSFNLVKYLRDGLYDFLPDNAHMIASGRLFVSLTRLSDGKNVLISQFESKDDLIQALTCSSFVPVYSGIVPPKFRGTYFVDGGITNNIPILDNNTITISPFAGESDICPMDNSANFAHIYLAGTSIQFTACNMYRVAHALFPPNPEVLSNFCQQGFDDALRYLQINNLIGCTRHLNIYSSLTTEVYLDKDDRESQRSCDSDVTDYSTDTNDSDLEMLTSNDLDEEDSDTEVDGECQDSECFECRRRRHVALVDSLPPQVVYELKAACESVNSHMLAPLYNLQAYKMASLLLAPIILPIEVSYILIKRICDRSNLRSVDMSWCLGELSIIARELYDIIQNNRHRYSARFSCQLAITENSIDVHGSATVGSGVGVAASKFAAPSPLATRRPLGMVPVAAVQPSTFDSPTDFGRDSATLDCIDEKSALGDFKSTGDVDGSTYDTFEDCLHVVNQMDSIISYYYADEDTHTVKVREIFPHRDTNNLQPTAPTANNHAGYCAYVGPLPKQPPKLMTPPLRLAPLPVAGGNVAAPTLRKSKTFFA